LANFQGTSSKIALNLSSALEKTLTLFFPECRSIELDWYVNTKYLGSATPRLLDSIFGCHIKPFHDGTSWKVMADDLDSALSLWSYTARGGEQPQVSGSEKSDDDSWLRSKIPRPSLRLFGPSDLWQFKQDLKVWAPGSLWETLLDLAEDTAGRKWFSNARVTGFTHRYEPQGTIGTETSNRYFSPRTPFDGGEPPAGFTWAVENHDPLELVFAKDLLFSFLCSATQMLEGPLKGRSERPTIMANRTFVESVGHLQNKTMDTLAAYLVDLGFGSEDEVYLTIATPLSMWDRLPIPFPFFEYRCTHFIASRKAGLWKIPSSTDICLPGYDRELRITHYHGLALLLEFNHVIYHELQLVTVEKLVSPIRITNALKRYVDWFSEEVDWDDLREFNISLRNVYSFQLRERDPIATLETISCPKHGSLYPNQYSQCMAADPSSQHAPTFHIAIGMTPLHLQVIESKNLSTELFHLVNERDICGLTPLHYACIKNPQAVERLLKGGADATLKDFRAYTPLHYACSSRSNLGVGDLLEAGATFDDQGIDGAFPTHLAAACGRTTVIDKMRPAMRNWNPKMVLVDAWRKKDFKGRIAVHWAAMHGQSTVIEMLKHDLDEEDNYGLTALHLTVIHDKCDVIKKLIELKADRNKKDKIGRTALKMAYQHGRQEAIKLLYSAEAEVDCHDDGIKTPDEQWLENIKAFRRVKIAAGEIEAESADTEGSEITMRSEGILSPWLQTMTHTEREPKGSGGDATV
jgi:ankyrin repeat protein